MADPLPQAGEPLDEDSHPILGVRDRRDVVAQIRPDDARVDDLRRPPERITDVARCLGRRRGGHAEQRRLAELRQCVANEEVVGAEVVPPHAHAVHLVDDDEADPDRAEHVEEAGLAQALGRGVDDPLLARGDACESGRDLVCRERGVDEGCGRRDLRGELVDLVLHERDQGREHERRLGTQHRGELVREGLAGSGRHERERVATGDGRAHDLLLAGTEGVEAEELAEWCLEVAQAGEYRSGAERRP